jgi:hypothetical protein
LSNTLAQLIELKYDILVTCIKCGHKAKVNLAKVVATSKRGDQVTVDDVRERLKCTECDSKNVSIIVAGSGWDDEVV